MKVGMIFECAPDGPDQQVCVALAHRLAPGIKVVCVALVNKPGLIEGCGQAAAQMLDEGCERVIIVWDLYPPWRTKGEKPCRKEDCDSIRRSLAEAEVDLTLVHLVCIVEELEAWLIADGPAISKVLSRKTHPVTVRHTSNPDRVRDPKSRLDRQFRDKTGRPYTPHIHAAQIIDALAPDLGRLRRVPSFVRFEARVCGEMG